MNIISIIAVIGLITWVLQMITYIFTKNKMSQDIIKGYRKMKNYKDLESFKNKMSQDKQIIKNKELKLNKRLKRMEEICKLRYENGISLQKIGQMIRPKITKQRVSKVLEAVKDIIQHKQKE